MTLLQFINALEKYSVDVLALALGVCLATSLIKKAIPSEIKKYITFIPFLLGCAAYAIFMFISNNNYNVFSSETAVKGFECGAAATIYYIIYEQFIRGKINLIDITDYKQLTVAEILKDFVVETELQNVSNYITKNIPENLSDVPFCITLCLNTLNGKTLPEITKGDITIISKLIVRTLSALK